MNSKTLVLACALTAATFSFNAFSQESAVCADPMKRICMDTQVQRDQREVYIEGLKKEIAVEAEKNAAPRISEMKKRYSSPLYFFKRLVETFKINNQEVMRSAKRRIGDIETVVTNPQNTTLLKNYMKTAIDESRFDQTTKTKFKATMDSILIGNFSDFIERTDLEDSALSQLMGSPCGADGMVANAFATTIQDKTTKKKQRYVLICPGFMITMTQTPDAKEKLNTILHAISHEMGHHIDNGEVGEELYEPYLSCLTENYATRFNKTKDDQKFCDKKAKSQQECDAKVVLSHAGELIADQWGIKVTAIHARTQGYSNAQTDSLLTTTWSALCPGKKELADPVNYTSDEGIHPTGTFRIETLMRTNPEIADYLSCNNSKITKPSCTLDGAVNI